MSYLRTKPGAGFPILAPAGYRILAVLDAFAKAEGVPLTITSGSEARGRADSDPHMTGEAVDVSVQWLPSSALQRLRQHCVDHLGPLFTVLVEAPPSAAVPLPEAYITRNPKATALHVHIQRKKGTVWP